jgi:hypothetical protein
MENWKKVEGYEAYEISDLGRVRRGEKVLKGSSDKNGYRVIGLCKDAVCKKTKIHRLVCIAFLPNPDSKPEVNHIDRNTANNRLDNLEWATRSEQSLHSPKPVGNSGHRYIFRRPCDSFLVQIMRDKQWLFRKIFPTLQEAITARDDILVNLH